MGERALRFAGGERAIQDGVRALGEHSLMHRESGVERSRGARCQLMDWDVPS